MNYLELLSHAVERGRESDVRAILSQGQDVNAILDRRTGETLLHRAVRKGQLSVCEVLISSGANVSVSELCGDRATPLHLAAGLPRLDVCALLLKAGANVNARRLHCVTPLMDAAGGREVNLAMCEMLAEHGADLDAMDRLGYTTLNMAIAFGWTPLARLLLERGADANRTGGLNFDAPLRNAIFTIVSSDETKTLEDEIVERVSLLLDYGADPCHIPDGCPASYLTPLQSAFVTNYVTFVDLFASRCVLDLDGRTAGGQTLDELCENDKVARARLVALRVEQVIRQSMTQAGSETCAIDARRATIDRSPI